MAPSSSSTSTDARLVRTRGKLLSAMLDLLEREPFEGITVRAITAEAGIGYATFFRHYPDKEALLDDLAAGEIAELLAKATPVFAAKDPHGACVALFGYVGQRRALWRALLTGGAAPILRAQFIEQARGLATSFERTASRGPCPVDLLITHAISATLEVIAWWLREDDDVAIDRMAGILDRLVIRPVISER